MRPLLERLSGIVTVLNTPFDEEGSVDLDSLARHVQYALDAGVAGFLVPAMASEVGKLTAEERDAILACVLEEVAGKAPVIGGASAADQTTRLHLAARAIDAGCDGVLVSMPYESDAQYVSDVRGIAACKPGFLMVQDWDFTGYGVPVPLIARLFEEVEAFQSLKIEVVPAGVKYSEVMGATGGRLHLAGGWAVTQMIEALDRGVHAMMPTGMHRTYVRIVELHRAGARAEAIDLFDQIAPVLGFSNQHLDISVHFFKRLLWRQGVYATPNVREPILPFDPYHARIADELIERVVSLEAALASGDSA